MYVTGSYLNAKVCINQHIQICTINAQSIKKQRAYHIVDEQKIDIAVICETWLRNRDDAWCICSILNNDGYVLVTQNRLKTEEEVDWQSHWKVPWISPLYNHHVKYPNGRSCENYDWITDRYQKHPINFSLQKSFKNVGVWIIIIFKFM